MSKHGFGIGRMQSEPLKRTGRVSIELSNRCDMAPFHSKCPLHGQTAPVFLPLKIATGVIAWLGKQKYDQIIGFHIYCEPLQDPRLYYLLNYSRKNCPGGHIFLMTNGHWLNQTILSELESFGVKKLYVSAYTDADAHKSRKLKAHKLKYRVRRIKMLDERVAAYDSKNAPLKKPCYAPLGEVVIRCTGHVALCCRDWASRHTFGNLYEESFADILLKPEMREAYRELSRGHRYFDLCRGCYMSGRYGDN